MRGARKQAVRAIPCKEERLPCNERVRGGEGAAARQRALAPP